MAISDLDSWGFVAHRIFEGGVVAGVLAQLMGNFRIVLCISDPNTGYDDGW